LLALGEAWLTAGKPDQALKVADALLRLNSVDGDAQGLMRKASIARTTDQGHWDEGGDYRGKLKDESESIALEKQSAPAAIHEPEVKADSSSKEQSMPEVNPLERAQDFVARYPGDLDGRYRLAQLLFDSGQTEEAIGEYQQTQKNPKLRVSSLLGMARCFRTRGLIDLAVAQLNTAKNELSGMDELKKDVVYELGCCYESLKKSDEAIAEFKAIYTEDIGFRDVSEKINKHYESS
jgi:tetratricopeptide (TPR) repeat protein